MLVHTMLTQVTQLHKFIRRNTTASHRQILLKMTACIALWDSRSCQVIDRQKGGAHTYPCICRSHIHRHAYMHAGHMHDLMHKYSHIHTYRTYLPTYTHACMQIPYHATPCHAMPYHTVPYHTVPYRIHYMTIQYSNCAVPYNACQNPMFTHTHTCSHKCSQACALSSSFVLCHTYMRTQGSTHKGSRICVYLPGTT